MRQPEFKMQQNSYSGFTLRPIHFWVFSVVVLGIVGRFVFFGRGYNYDFESYKIIVAANRQGITPWLTNRYNYGPIWWYLLRLFDWTHTQTGIGIRYQIVGLLTIADLSIAYFVYRLKGSIFGALFFINPISIIISGYHNQFDNLAIAIVCIAVYQLQRVRDKSFIYRDISVVLLLGTSLATKHVFIFFVAWLALRQTTVFRKSLYLLGPLLVFCLSFVPYLGSSWNAIKLNVFEYRSNNNAPFWKIIGIYDGDKNQVATVLFIFLITIIGFFLRKIRLESSLFVYCIVIVAFSPGITNQYLAIATIGATGLANTGFAMYFLYGTYWLSISPDGLHYARQTRWIGNILFNEPGLYSLAKFGYEPFPILLLLGLFITFLKFKSRRSGRPTHA